MELNPNHPVTKQVRDNWHKVAAILMLKFGQRDVEITQADLEKLCDGDVNIVLDARGESKTGSFWIRLVDDRAAAELAKNEGGRAIDS